MKPEYLVKMANDIAAFYSAESSGAEVPKNIAAHITRYWDPRMRKAIIDYNAANGDGMKSEVRDAVSLLPAPNT